MKLIPDFFTLNYILLQWCAIATHPVCSLLQFTSLVANKMFSFRNRSRKRTKKIDFDRYVFCQCPKTKGRKNFSLTSLAHCINFRSECKTRQAQARNITVECWPRGCFFILFLTKILHTRGRQTFYKFKS